MRSIPGMFAPVINSRSFDVHSQDKRITVFIPLPIQNWLFPIIGCFLCACRCEDVYVPWNSLYLEHEAAGWVWFPFLFLGALYFVRIFCGEVYLRSRRLVFISQWSQRSNKSEQQHLLVTSCIIPGHRQTCQTQIITLCGQDKTPTWWENAAFVKKLNMYSS